MFRVVLLPPPALATRVDEVRRRLDPAFHRVPAHIPLIAPFDGEATATFTRFDRATRCSSFAVEFGEPTRKGSRLVLPVRAGTEPCLELRSALEDGLGTDPSPGGPDLLLGRSESPAELELAARSLSADPRSLSGFDVRTVTLLTEDARGLWVVARTRPLR